MQRVNKRICGRCGSSNLISDRSLGGKIICVKCGSSFIKTKGFIHSNKKYFYYLILILLLIILILVFS